MQIIITETIQRLMGSLDNLNKFEKGKSGNPDGRPKGSRNRSTIARKWLETMETVKNPITGENETLSQEDLMTLAMVKKARKGNEGAYKALMDSGFGAPKQVVESSTTDFLTPEERDNRIKALEKKMKEDE